MRRSRREETREGERRTEGDGEDVGEERGRGQRVAGAGLLAEGRKECKLSPSRQLSSGCGKGHTVLWGLTFRQPVQIASASSRHNRRTGSRQIYGILHSKTSAHSTVQNSLQFSEHMGRV